VHIILFCREFNTFDAKVLNIFHMRRVVTQCHKICFESATFATKLCTRRDETRLDSAEHSVLKPESWTCSVDFGTLTKGIVSATVAPDKWHSGFTPSEQRALHSFKVNYVIKFSLQMKRTFPFE